MRLSEIAEYMVDNHMENNLSMEVIRDNREKWYDKFIK